MEAIAKSTDAMAEIVKVISQIDKKTRVINEIVTKTELLSFNASVEAARAGEHGKGFAVVAEEVGNLARMSGSAAEEISTLLESSIASVNGMVADTKKQVEVGSVVTRKCGDIFEDIVKNISLVSEKAMEIASASQEQANGAGEISRAMGQLDHMTQQNAATSEECASAASELSGQAESLSGIVGHLKSIVYGGKPESTMEEVIVGKKSQHHETSKIIPLKRKAHQPVEEVRLAKAAPDDAPGYDDAGFTDI
jgi:methyl-accepting chemotaxis protein